MSIIFQVIGVFVPLQLCPYHFNPPGVLHPITVIYELSYGETEMKQGMQLFSWTFSALGDKISYTLYLLWLEKKLEWRHQKNVSLWLWSPTF